MPKCENTGEAALSGVSNSSVLMRCWLTRVAVGQANSERTQQNGADEHEHGTYCQQVEIQGLIHVSFSRVVSLKQD